jgi:hypothetical protein
MQLLTISEINGARLRLRWTIGNRAWMSVHAKGLAHAIPDHWTPANGAAMIYHLGTAMSARGVSWQGSSDILVTILYFAKLRLIEFDNRSGLARRAAS